MGMNTQVGNHLLVEIFCHLFSFFFLLLGEEETQLASHVLQFIFLSDCGFRFPIAQFPSHDCTPSDLFALFWQGVRMMQEFGFT